MVIVNAYSKHLIYTNCREACANSVDPDRTMQNPASALFAADLAVLIIWRDTCSKINMHLDQISLNAASDQGLKCLPLVQQPWF